jgi:SAM-dependent methyltransferase
MSDPASKPWWHDLYDDLLAEVLLVRADRAELDATLRFITEKLGVGPSDRVLDQCCGIGSLALELASRGLSVVGVEQSAPYVERALATARERGLFVDLVAADARDWLPKKRVRGAFNWWTSFGYSEDDRDNARLLDRAFEALEPGGRFLLDTMNVPGVLRSFQEETVTRRATPRGEIVLLRRSRIDARAGVMRKRWSYVLPDGNVVEKQESVVRLYLPHTLAEMLEAAGFRDVELFGDVTGRPLELDSHRCILLAKKP